MRMKYLLFKNVRGMSLLEVLISIVIISIGLLGVAALQGKSQRAELESYQRTQALLLVRDMVSRMNLNRVAIDCYWLEEISTSNYAGVNSTPSVANCPGVTSIDISKKNLAIKDIADWDAMLDGSAEQLGDDNVGAMIGARGCVMYDATNDVYTIAVAWQGLSNTIAPSNDCAKDLYGDDRLRRVITATVQIADLN